MIWTLAKINLAHPCTNVKSPLTPQCAQWRRNYALPAQARHGFAIFRRVRVHTAALTTDAVARATFWSQQMCLHVHLQDGAQHHGVWHLLMRHYLISNSSTSRKGTRQRKRRGLYRNLSCTTSIARRYFAVNPHMGWSSCRRDAGQKE